MSRALPRLAFSPIMTMAPRYLPRYVDATGHVGVRRRAVERLLEWDDGVRALANVGREEVRHLTEDERIALRVHLGQALERIACTCNDLDDLDEEEHRASRER